MQHSLDVNEENLRKVLPVYELYLLKIYEHIKANFATRCGGVVYCQ